MHGLIERIGAAWRRRAFALKAVSFAAVGVVNTLIDLAVFFACYQGAQLPLVLSNVLAWMVAVSCSYVMNTFITFGPESGRVLRLRDYGAFVLSGVAGVIATTTTLVLLSQFIPVIAAKLLSIAVSFAVNFTLSHFVVFRRRRHGDPPPLQGNG